MSNNEGNSILSFSSLLQIGSEPKFQLQLVVSKPFLDSYRSFDMDNILENQEEVSLQQIHQPELFSKQEISKEMPPVTYQNFQTPNKKKKTGCVCKKTQCMKLYCECFASGKVCTDQCACHNCQNQSENSKKIESARTFRKNRSRNQTEKRSCTCKKSRCLKQYCQCFKAGFSCTSECKCEGCENCQNSEEGNHSHSHNIPSKVKEEPTEKEYKI